MDSLLLFWCISLERVWCEGVIGKRPRVFNTPLNRATWRTISWENLSAHQLPQPVSGVPQAELWQAHVSHKRWLALLSSPLPPACWDEEEVSVFRCNDTQVWSSYIRKGAEGESHALQRHRPAEHGTAGRQGWEWEWGDSGDQSPLLTGHCKASMAC